MVMERGGKPRKKIHGGASGGNRLPGRIMALVTLVVTFCNRMEIRLVKRES